MKETWRWFGPQDPVSLDQVKQAGATGVVSALHHLYRGEAWPLEEVLKRKAQIEAAGLVWSVLESIPVHNSIKLRTGPFRQFTDAWKDSLAAMTSLRSRGVLQSLCNHLMRSTTYFHVLWMQSVLCMSLQLRFMTDSNPTLSAIFLPA